MIDASMSAMSLRKEENALDLKVKNVLFGEEMFSYQCAKFLINARANNTAVPIRDACVIGSHEQ